MLLVERLENPSESSSLSAEAEVSAREESFGRGKDAENIQRVVKDVCEILLQGT